MKRWPKMRGVVTVLVDDQLFVGRVTGKNKSARHPVFHVDGILTCRVQDEGTTWARGRENAETRVLEAIALLRGSAR